MPNKNISDIKLAIVKDPNGLQVRLMELSPEQLNEPSSGSKKPVIFLI